MTKKRQTNAATSTATTQTRRVWSGTPRRDKSDGFTKDDFMRDLKKAAARPSRSS
jgi:hypothetical protein